MAEEYGKDRKVFDFKDPIKQEFIIRSAAYLSADSVIDRFQECTKLQFDHQPSIFKGYVRYRNTYRNSKNKVEKELALEKARYVNLSYTRDHWGHKFSLKNWRLHGFEVGFNEILEGITTSKDQLIHLRNVNRDLALLVNTTETGKKYDKVLNEQTPIKKYAKNVSREYDFVTQSKDKNFNLLANSINEFVYNGKNKKSAEEFAEALMKHVKTQRDAAGAGYDKAAVERDLTTARTGFLVNNTQYNTIKEAYDSAVAAKRTDTLETRKLQKQLEKLTDLATLYVKHDDEPKKLAHTLGNGMSSDMYSWQYDDGNDKMKTTDALDIQDTIRLVAWNSSTYALTGIYNIDNDTIGGTIAYDPVMTKSLCGLNNTDYFQNGSKTYEDIATAIDSQHADAKTKKVRGKSTEPEDREIKHDELYKIEGLETFLVYTYNRARARALAAGKSEEEADFRAMAMTQAMDRKILNDDDFRAQLEEQIKEEEKQKINLLMLGYVKNKAGDIYADAAAPKNAADINTAIENQVAAVDAGDSPVLNSIVNEVAPNEAKNVLNITVRELKHAVTTEGSGGKVFGNAADITAIVEKKEEATKKLLSDTRSRLEKLCTNQFDAMEKNLDLGYKKYEQIKKARAIIAVMNKKGGYKYDDKCSTMVTSHASKLDNFSADDLQNFGMTCNALAFGKSRPVVNQKEAIDNLAVATSTVRHQSLNGIIVREIAYGIANASPTKIANKHTRKSVRDRSTECIVNMAEYTKNACIKGIGSDTIKQVASTMAKAKDYTETRLAITNLADKTKNLTGIVDVDKIKTLATTIKNAKNNGVKKRKLLQDKEVANAINNVGKNIGKNFVDAVKEVYDLCEGDTIENIVHTIADAYNKETGSRTDKKKAADTAAKQITNVCLYANDLRYYKYSADAIIDVTYKVCNTYDNAYNNAYDNAYDAAIAAITPPATPDRDAVAAAANAAAAAPAAAMMMLLMK